MDAELARECANKLKDEMTTEEMGRWSFEELYWCLRDNLCCVYCGCDLIKDRDDFSGRAIFNYFRHFDRLLPKGKYPELEEVLSNRVLCCVPCNQLKGDWDPNVQMPIYVAGSGQFVEEEWRGEFINRTKKHLQELRRAADENFAKQKSRIIDCIKGGADGKGNGQQRLEPTPSEVAARKVNLKRWLGISASFGAGTVLMIALLLGGIAWQSSRPKPWNTGAVQARFASLKLTAGVDTLPVEFEYDLENKTDANYLIGDGSSMIVMARLTQGDVLSEDFGHSPASKAKVSGPSFIPPTGVGRITVHVTYDYPSDFTPGDKSDAQKVSRYLGSKVRDISGFVAFDQSNHYQIELPSGWEKFHPN
jgi:hypothetical protein